MLVFTGDATQRQEWGLGSFRKIAYAFDAQQRTCRILRKRGKYRRDHDVIRASQPVQVADLVEDRAQVEIEATAVVPDEVN